MKVSEQCDFIASKGNQINWLIRRNVTMKQLIIDMYKAIIKDQCKMDLRNYSFSHK